MKKMLEGKNVIVTGTARGMGKRMTELFAENGANVIACARKEADEHKKFCGDLEEKYAVQVYPVYFDLSEPDEIKKGFNTIRSLKIPVDGLVNNAGIAGNTLFHMTRMEELRKIFEVDFFGPYLLTQYVSKLMLRTGGGASSAFRPLRLQTVILEKQRMVPQKQRSSR